MPTIYKRGWRKNVALTAWLLLPIAFVAVLVVGIFISYSKGPAMHARPVGQGAGDTGGANALGEFFAGRDVLADEQTRRDLREGRLIDPLDWPHGIRIAVSSHDTSIGVHTVWLWGGRGGPTPGFGVTTELMAPSDPSSAFPLDPKHATASTTIQHEQIQRIFGQGRPGAGLYVSPTKVVTPKDALLIDADGNPLERIEIPLVPREDTTEGEPIEIHVILGNG